ncbi:hypothetical protein NXY56_008153 [Leishmania guyanensis]
MVRYNTAVMTLLKRMGPRKERGLSQLPNTLLGDLSRTTHNMVARLSFHWESERTNRTHNRSSEEMVQGKSVPSLDQISDANRVPLAEQIPCLLLCLQLSPPALHTSSVSILNRFVLFNVPVRGSAPQVNAIFAAIILHLLPRPYATVPTINLIFAVITIGTIRISNSEAEKWAGRKESGRGVPQWVQRQNAEVRAFLAGLPRWLQALVPTTDNLDLAEIIDEIARRLPPADEGLPGDYVDVLAARTDEECAKYDYGFTVRNMYHQSTTHTVSPAEFLMLVPKLITFSAKFSRMRVAAQMAQNERLLDFSPPVNREALYSAFACTALRGALLNLSLLRHTEKILAVRELSSYEWFFITSIVTGREKAWAPTAYTAMRIAGRVAEERRRDEIKRSGKAERDVSLWGSMDAKGRFLVLAHYSSGMNDLRFDHDLFSAALECTEPLMREYFRALEVDTNSSLKALDMKYHVRQFLSVVTRADNINEEHLGEGSEDVADEEEAKAESSRMDGVKTTTGKATLSLLQALEKFFTEPMPAGSAAAVAPAPSDAPKRGSGFARTNLPDKGCGAATLLEDPPDEELTLRMHIVECAMVYCLCRHEQTTKCDDTASELIDLSLRSARRMQRIIGVQLRYISSVIRSTDWDSQETSLDVGMSCGTSAETVVVDGVKGEKKTLQLAWSTMKLLSALTARKDLNLAARGDLAEIASAIMTDIAIFIDSIHDHRVLPNSLNRNLAMLQRWYTAHKRMLKSSAIAADAPPFRKVDESARMVVASCFGVVQRVFPPRHHQRLLTGAASTLSFGFHKKLVMVRTLDSAVSLALTANMTLDELPHIADIMAKTVDAIREAAQMRFQVPPSDTQRYEAERKLRSSLLPKTIHLLHHMCTLAVNDEACLTATAAAVAACSGEEHIAFLSWKKRESVLSMTSYVYRVLADRFAQSRASRDLAHQLLIMVSRLALDRLAYKDSLVSVHEPKECVSDREVELRHLVCASLMWQVSCVVASTLLQSVPLDKYLGIMHTYIKRHFVISMGTQEVGESSTLGMEAELEYCERVLAEVGLSARSATMWVPTTTKEEVILQCNFAIADVFYALKFLASLLYTDSCTSNSPVFRTRWISHAELACGLLRRYQRWIAPSVWRNVWRELVAVNIMVRIGRFTSLQLQEATETAAQRLLVFSKIRDNKGVWIDTRVPHPAASVGDARAHEEASAATGNTTATPELLCFLDLSRMFELQEQLTDINVRIYLAQLTDRLSRECEEHVLSLADSGTNLEGERRFSSNGVSETQAEREQRQLRAARMNILFTCRRMRS